MILNGPNCMQMDKHIWYLNPFQKRANGFKVINHISKLSPFLAFFLQLWLSLRNFGRHQSRCPANDHQSVGAVFKTAALWSDNPCTQRLYHIWRLPKTILLKAYVRTIRFAPPSPFGPEAGCLYRCHTALKSKAGKKFWGAIIFTQTKMEANFWPLITKWYTMGLTASFCVEWNFFNLSTLRSADLNSNETKIDMTWKSSQRILGDAASKFHRWSECSSSSGFPWEHRETLKRTTNTHARNSETIRGTRSKTKKHTSKSIDCGKALAFNICPVQNDSWSAKGQLCSDSISWVASVSGLQTWNGTFQNIKSVLARKLKKCRVGLGSKCFPYKEPYL